MVVVGAGPTGLACGIELQQRGLKTVLVEKGCVVNSIYHYPTNMTFFTTPELLEIGNIPMTSLNDKPNRTEALKYYRRVAEHFRLDVRQYERVDRIAGGDGAFEVFTTGRAGASHVYGVRKIVLATGYYDVPNMLGVPGEALDKVLHYYKEAHPYYNHDVAVIGAKNSAAIAALELWWTGARVTLIHRGAAIAVAVGRTPQVSVLSPTRDSDPEHKPARRGSARAWTMARHQGSGRVHDTQRPWCPGHWQSSAPRTAGARPTALHSGIRGIWSSPGHTGRGFEEDQPQTGKRQS